MCLLQNLKRSFQNIIHKYLFLSKKSCFNIFKFEGYSQQDSQELISYLLDALHEDLNRIKEKPLVNAIEADGKPDNIVSKLNWEAHSMRNQSKIIDLFYGQYKSTIECPKCSFISITFDPFHLISLPIPNESMISLHIYYISQNYSDFALKFRLTLKENTFISVIKQMVCKKLNFLEENHEVYLLKDQLIVEKVDENKNLKYLDDAKNHFCMIFEMDNKIEDQYKILVELSFKKDTDVFACSYSRPFYYLRSSCKKDLHLKIYEKIRFFIINQKKCLDINVSIDSKKISFDKLFKEYSSSYNEKDFFYKLFYKNNYKTNKTCLNCSKIDCEGCLLAFNTESIDNLVCDSKILIEVNLNPNYSLKNYKLNLYEKKYLTPENENQTKNHNKKINLEDCLDLFSEKEILTSENKWYCPKCKGHMGAHKKIEIYQAPPNIIFHIKRFKRVSRFSNSYYAMSYNVTKIDNLINFPIENLYLNKYVLGLDKGERLIYDLYAVCNHYGGVSGGHYTAFAKNMLTKEWYEFNDNLVTKISEDSVVSKAAYVLFYKLRKK